jgi:hypothetical protein
MKINKIKKYLLDCKENGWPAWCCPWQFGEVCEGGCPSCQYRNDRATMNSAGDTIYVLCGEDEEVIKINKIINTTPHEIRFQAFTGDIYEVPPCGVLINARPIEAPAGFHTSGAELVRTTFQPDPDSEVALEKLETENPGAIIVGSIIAAQAFPGRVLALVPAPGFERVPPAEKRMRDDKFTTFQG